MTPIWSPLWLSLQIATVATVLTLIVGIPLAYAMARTKFEGKGLVEGLIMLPLVLPPTVVGYFILIVFGTNGWVGRWLMRWFEYTIAFKIPGAILAATIVALPLLYIPAKSAFGSVERELEDLARLLGANRLQLFWYVSIPMARRGLLGGIILAFARALGEFGATMMVFGIQPTRMTLPISIYADYEHQELSSATGAVLALSVISMALIMAYNASSAGRQE
jgi:molybdate transport system permease protein